MASTKKTNNNQIPIPQNTHFLLNQHQQDLLFAALNSNSAPLDPTPNMNMGIGFNNSPLQAAPGSAITAPLDESPFVDYDYNFDDAVGDFGEFDFSTMPQGQMIGAIPNTGAASSSDGDAPQHDKRGLSEDDLENDEHDEKRREQDEPKGAKKPGRKPLTSEPTSKRKAQNRAAQRAFRERKEKHLKDLETKVQDLEKASESANHENVILRAKVERMAAELKEYKKRLSLHGNTVRPVVPIPSYLKGANELNNPQDVNFSFEFPRFGRLPGPPEHKSDSHVPQAKSTTSPTDQPSRSTSFGSTGISPSSQGIRGSLFSPTNLDSQSPTNNWPSSRASTDSTTVNSTSGSANGHNTSHSSPASSNSQVGPSSSCGTSPEPYTQSPPAGKSLDSHLPTIGEEVPKLGGDATQTTFCEKLSMVCGSSDNPVPRTIAKSPEMQFPIATTTNTFGTTGQTPNYDYNSLDWFAAQNNNAFDPQLFGDYRESQDSILSNTLYDDTFFNEAFALPADMNTFNFDPSVAVASPDEIAHPDTCPKKGLMAQIDDKLAGNDDDEEVVPSDGNMLTCTTMWDKIQSCPRVQNGEIDMDALCTELQSKAKCSGEGPVIQEKEFKEVLNTMFLAKGLSPCDD